MKPFGKPLGLFLFAGCCLAVSCAATKMTNVWRDESYRGTMGKTVVIGIFQEPDTREIFEDEFSDRLRARGVDATASRKIVPDAEMPDKEAVIGKIRKFGADTVLITRVMEMDKETAYAPGRAYLVPHYYGYYGSYYSYSYRPSYSVQEGEAFLETNLYNVRDEKLIWSARSTTKLKATRYELIQGFVKEMIDGLSDAGLIR